MYLALYIVTTLSFIGFSGWFLADPHIIPVFGMAFAVAGMIGVWLTDEERKDKEKKYWEERRLTVGIASDRVEKELDHLFALRSLQATKRTDSQHGTAVQPAYELLYRDVSILVPYWSYAALARKAMAEIEAMQKHPDGDVNPLLRVMEKLGSKLRSDPAWRKFE